MGTAEGWLPSMTGTSFRIRPERASLLGPRPLRSSYVSTSEPSKARRELLCGNRVRGRLPGECYSASVVMGIPDPPQSTYSYAPLCSVICGRRWVRVLFGDGSPRWWARALRSITGRPPRLGGSLLRSVWRGFVGYGAPPSRKFVGGGVWGGLVCGWGQGHFVCRASFSAWWGDVRGWGLSAVTVVEPHQAGGLVC